MNSYVKIHLASAGYGVLLGSLNWSRSIEYSRQLGTTSESVDPVALAFLISAGVSLYLIYRCVSSALSRLESGRRVREGKWIESWGVVVYALPLLWHRTSTSSWIEPDGTLATVTGGYGHALSNWIFLWAILGLLLFQILARLTADDEPPNLPSQPTRFARG